MSYSVVLQGAPWGFRFKGGKEFGQPLKISKVNPGSKAAKAGIIIGDLVKQINGQDAANLEHNQALNLVKEAKSEIELVLERSEDSLKDKNMARRTEKTFIINNNNNEKDSLDARDQLNTATADSVAINQLQKHRFSFEFSSDGTPKSRGADMFFKRQKFLEDLDSQDSKVDETQVIQNSSPPPQSLTSKPGAWSPGRPQDSLEGMPPTATQTTPPPPLPRPPPPVWSPPKRSEPEVSAKEYKPVKLVFNGKAQAQQPPVSNSPAAPAPPQKRSSWKATPDPLNGPPSPLPRTQSPAVTLLQHHRGHQSATKDARQVYQKQTVEGDLIHTDTYYVSPVAGEEASARKVVHKGPLSYDGIGPKDNETGMPVGLRSGVKEDLRSDWYKQMYKSIHRHDKKEDANNKYERFLRDGTLEGNSYSPTYTFPEEKSRDDKKENNSYQPTYDFQKRYGTTPTSEPHGSSWTVPSAKNKIERYQQQPRRIEDYEPGKSSLAAKERVTSHIHNPPLDKPNTSYTTDDPPRTNKPTTTTTSFEENLSDVEESYRYVQKGGEIPARGLQMPAPAPHHPTGPKLAEYRHSSTSSLDKDEYRSPVSTLERERERHKILTEEKKRRLEVEREEQLRHYSHYNPLNSPNITNERFKDEFPEEDKQLPDSQALQNRPSQTRKKANVLYNFLAQNSKELSLKKGDVVYLLRQIDNNWYEGEHHGSVGIFPIKYVEIMTAPDTAALPVVQDRKAQSNHKVEEGLAKAKYSFQGQSSVELNFRKGENIHLLRKIDDNWYEGKIGNREGIFPVSYVEVVREPRGPLSPALSSPITVDTKFMPPQQSAPNNSRYSSPPKGRMQQPSPAAAAVTAAPRPREPGHPGHQQAPPQSRHYASHSPLTMEERERYQVIFSYLPQNHDELELTEGDIVYVVEHCDDGWYVGMSTRTGQFGTFPGNYVAKL